MIHVFPLIKKVSIR